MGSFLTFDVNYIDMIVGTTVLILGLKGILNGLIKEVFGLLGLMAGGYAASMFSNEAADFIYKNIIDIENNTLLKLFGFLSIFMIVWVFSTALGFTFSKLSSASGLGFLNRLLGFIIGGGKYFVVISVISVILSDISLIKVNTEKYTSTSLVYPYLLKTGVEVMKLSPKKIDIEKMITPDFVSRTLNFSTEKPT